MSHDGGEKLNAVTVVSTDAAPKAIGPYSQALIRDGWVFLSGQIPLDAKTGELVGGDAAEQARQCMTNLGAVLAAAGCGFESVMRTTIYLVDLGDFVKVNEVYGSFFATIKPARSTIQVAALPRGARVEIDAIAMKPGIG